MRVIIAGSRSIVDYEVVKNAVKESGFDITEILCGDARGVDSLGNKYGIENNIKVRHFPADWKTHSKKAGFLRNLTMAENADALIAVWDGESKGTMHMITIMSKIDMPVYVKVVNR